MEFKHAYDLNMTEENVLFGGGGINLYSTRDLPINRMKVYPLSYKHSILVT